MALDPANPSTVPNHNSPDDPFIGYFNGVWVPQQDIKLSVSDDGFRFAATAVERLRAYQGIVFQLPAHLRRWRGTLATIGIVGTPSDSTVSELIEELLRRNQGRVSRHGDVGITLVATPGDREIGRPTFALHVNAIDHHQTQARRKTGQPLVLTDVVQPSPASWPRDIKVRCRLHYYLADQIARKSHADASGVLLDEDGSVTETSIANLAIVKDGKIISPPKDRVLGGITQQVIEGIAQQHSIVWTKRPVQPQELQDADEVILMGTDTGIWFGNQVNGSLISSGPIYAQLLQAFDGFVAGEGSNTCAN